MVEEFVDTDNTVYEVDETVAPPPPTEAPPLPDGPAPDDNAQKMYMEAYMRAYQSINPNASTEALPPSAQPVVPAILQQGQIAPPASTDPQDPNGPVQCFFCYGSSYTCGACDGTGRGRLSIKRISSLCYD